MQGKVNKSSFRSEQSDILYKSVIKKSVMFFCLLLFIVLSVTIYFTADLYAQYCVSKIKRMERITEVGLRDFMLTQKKQISCIKKRIRGAKKLTNFSKLLASCTFLEIDRFLIDYDGKVIYSSSSDKVNNSGYYNDESLGFSFDKLKNNHDRVFIGNIIEDKKLKRRYFFIVSGASNKYSDFRGAVLLKVYVDYLNKKIVPLKNRILTIRDNVDEDELHNSIYKQLERSPIKTFLSKYLLSNSDNRVIKYNSSFNKYTESKYISKYIVKSFWCNIYLFGCIVCVLLIVVFFIYWRMILLPMKESLMMIQKNRSGRKNIDKLFSIFYRLNDFNLDQTALISKQEQEQREQFTKIISIIFSIGSLAHYVTSKVEVLKEDVADMCAKCAKNNKKKSSIINFNQRLRDIEKTIDNSEQDIRLLTSEYTKFTELIKTQNREDIKIGAHELSKTISSKLSPLKYNQVVQITPQIEFNIHVYESFFVMLLDEILNFNGKDLSLEEIKITKDKKLVFIFKKINSSFINFQNEQITLCKMLGMFNDIKVSISQEQEIVSINLNFSV